MAGLTVIELYDGPSEEECLEHIGSLLAIGVPWEALERYTGEEISAIVTGIRKVTPTTGDDTPDVSAEEADDSVHEGPSRHRPADLSVIQAARANLGG